MVIELGPCAADDVLRWSKFARRILVELRTTEDEDQAVVSPDVLELWSRTLDEWSGRAVESANHDAPFRWSSEVEPEVAEFLLHGLDKCLHSPRVMGWVTPAEAEEQRAFTMLVVRSFVDGLAAEGEGCRHFADQILTSLQDLLQD